MEPTPTPLITEIPLQLYDYTQMIETLNDALLVIIVTLGLIFGAMLVFHMKWGRS